MVPVLVVTEVVHFVGTRLGGEAEVRFLGDLASGVFTVDSVRPADWLRIAELVWTYRDARLGTVDASVVTAGERLEITTLATLDRRHFDLVRPVHAQAFEILP